MLPTVHFHVNDERLSVGFVRINWKITNRPKQRVTTTYTAVWMPVEEETTTAGAGTTQVSHTPDQPDSVCVCVCSVTHRSADFDDMI